MSDVYRDVYTDIYWTIDTATEAGVGESMGTELYLGPPGGLILLPRPDQGIALPLSRPSAVQELADGGRVVDRFGRGRRRYLFRWTRLDPDGAAILERLWLLPGTLILDDPSRRNRLTANQSSGGDVRRTTEGVIARFQGSVSRSTAQARSGTGSFAWSTGTALAATGRGLYFYSSATVPDDTWHPVRPGAIYSGSVYLRASAAVSMQAIIDWCDVTGTVLTTDFGGGAAVSTSGFTRVTVVNKTAPASAAYGILAATNTTTTGAAITVWYDDPQMEEAAQAGAQVIGTGVARVATEGDFPMESFMLGDYSPELSLTEV